MIPISRIRSPLVRVKRKVGVDSGFSLLFTWETLRQVPSSLPLRLADWRGSIRSALHTRPFVPPSHSHDIASDIRRDRSARPYYGPAYLAPAPRQGGPSTCGIIDREALRIDRLEVAAAGACRVWVAHSNARSAASSRSHPDGEAGGPMRSQAGSCWKRRTQIPCRPK